MRAFNSPSNGSTPGLAIVLGTAFGWPAYALRELLNAVSVAFVLFVLCLICLYILGASVEHEANKKLSAIPKFLTHGSVRLQTPKQPAESQRYDVKRPAA